MSDYIPNPESYLDNFDFAFLMAAGEDPFDFGFIDNQPSIGSEDLTFMDPTLEYELGVDGELANPSSIGPGIHPCPDLPDANAVTLHP